jgi:ribonuclease D
VEYAIADVTHLRDVYRVLSRQLEAEHRADWVDTEMDILTSIDTYRTEPENAWKRLKMRVRRPIELQVLKEVAAWREQEAQARDVPRGRILKDEAIYEIAAQQPTTPEALAALRTTGRGFERSRAGEEIIGAVERALAVPKGELPKLPKARPMVESNTAAVDLLKVLLKMTSEAHGVAPKVIATVDDLEAIAADDDADVPALSGWRRELFGDLALRLKRGDVALRLDGRRVVLLESPARTAEAAE